MNLTIEFNPQCPCCLLFKTFAGDGELLSEVRIQKEFKDQAVERWKTTMESQEITDRTIN